MRLFGHLRSICSNRLPATKVGLVCLLLAGLQSPLRAQAPFVIPYTITTLAGGYVAVGGTAPSSTIKLGASCSGTTGAPYALDSLGDGCPASNALIAADPHDVRVDYRGNIFYANNSNGVVHKFNPYTLNMSTYVGNLVSAASCTKAGPFGTADKYGDGCYATDGLANNSLTSSGTQALFTPVLKGIRGLGLAPNGNLFIASYNDDLIHEVTASTNFFSIIAGTLAPGAVATTGTTNGPSNGSLLNTPRGVGADANGNVFIADTGNNILRLANQFTAPSTAVPGYTPGVVSNYTAPNTAATASFTPTSYANALLKAPEDVKIDGNGNIYIADFGNQLLRVIYNSAGIGTIPNVANPVPGNVYVVAGNAGAAVPNNTYPTGDYATTGALTGALVPALNVQIGGIRKISIDSRNNIYIADSGNEVVWFLDATTGYMRAIAGSFGQTPTAVTTTKPAWVCTNSINAIGDGCPGTQANLDAVSNMGVDVDSTGNAYITDSEGGSAGVPRIRKLVSGLNFPATAPSASVTQQILIHLAAGDTPLSSNPAFFRGASDFSVAAPTTCTTQADTTTDCLVTVKFTPTQTGFESGSLFFDTTNNGEALFVVTGVGTSAAVAFDPGNTSLFANVTNPQGITVDSAGNFYIANTAAGTVTSYLPNGTLVFTYGAGVLKSPTALAFGTDGALYIADPGQNSIYRLDLARTTTPVRYAGGGTPCAQASDAFGDNCSALNATFNAPSGLATDNLGNLFVADTGNNIIRIIGRNGWVSLFAGAGASCTAATDSLGDGCAATQATFNKPTGLAFDFTGKYLFVADTGNSEVRKIYLDATYSYSPATGTPTTSTGIVVNPVTLVAGTGLAQSTANQSSIAALSGLSNPTGVAVDAAENVYIADTGNHAIRMVTPGTGVISTIAGILGTSGAGTVPAAATVTQLNAPSAIAVSPLGTLYITDAGNNRVLTDSRSNTTFNFGRLNLGTASPVQNITQVNISNVTATPIDLTQATPDAEFTLTPAANSNSSIPACAVSSGTTKSTLAPGTACNLQAQFTPANPGPLSSTFTETGSNAVNGAPSITLAGTGAVLTPTSAAVVQTTPATGNPEFGGPLTFTATVTPSACNTAAPACYPTGTVTFVIDGTPSAPITLTGSGTSLTLPLPATANYSATGLAVQTHAISCNYSGDAFYAAYTCPTINIPVTQASTKSSLAFAPGTNNQSQYPTANCTGTSLPYTCTQTTLVATVASTTVGIPTGSVTFLVNGAPLNGTDVNPIGLNSAGVATLPLTFTVTPNGVLSSDGSLAPGTYNLSCVFNGPSGSNYSGSSCTPIQFTVVPQTAKMSLQPRGCIASSLYPGGSFTAVLGSQCPSGITTNGVPTVATADGSTTDATIFILPSNTLGGTITFSCSGLPANTACTFQPTSITLTPGTSYAAPVYTDVTFFTDVKQTSAIAKPTNGTSLAMILGWPLTAFSLIGLLVLRRRKSLRGLSLLAMVVLMAGSALTFSGCAGPGDYVPSLTPAGTYPVTITATNGTITSTTVVDVIVTAPGIPGQQ